MSDNFLEPKPALVRRRRVQEDMRALRDLDNQFNL